MGLVFLALPKEFLHGLEKVSIHLRLKGWIGIAHLLFKLPSMKPGSLFWRFHVAMSKVAEAWEDTAYSAALLFIFFLIREHELCCLVASGREPRSCRVFFFTLVSPNSAWMLQPLVLLCTHEHPGKTGRCRCSYSADKGHRGFSKAKVAVMGSALSERCQELFMSATLEIHRWNTWDIRGSTEDLAQVPWVTISTSKSFLSQWYVT